MVFGSFVVALCLIVLGWTAEIVGLFVTDPEKVLMPCDEVTCGALRLIILVSG